MTRQAAIDTYFQAVETRRTNYTLTDKSTLSDAELQAIVERAIKHTPSSYNSQTSRAVLVTGDKYRELWAAIWETFKQVLPAEVAPTFQAKFDNVYSKGYGTVVFFEDQDAIDKFVAANPFVKDIAPQFAHNTSGIAQSIVWTSFSIAGLGCNLQHYNLPIINKVLGVPESWKPNAELVFGVPSAGPGDKTFQPIEERVKVVA